MPSSSSEILAVRCDFSPRVLEGKLRFIWLWVWIPRSWAVLCRAVSFLALLASLLFPERSTPILPVGPFLLYLPASKHEPSQIAISLSPTRPPDCHLIPRDLRPHCIKYQPPECSTSQPPNPLCFSKHWSPRDYNVIVSLWPDTCFWNRSLMETGTWTCSLSYARHLHTCKRTWHKEGPSKYLVSE